MKSIMSIILALCIVELKGSRLLQQEVPCPSDVTLCSDGSFKSRDPTNNCKFRPCPQEANPCVEWENCGSYTPDGCNICGCSKEGIRPLCTVAACPPDKQIKPECSICIDGFMLNPITKQCDSCSNIACDIPQCKPGEKTVVLAGNCCPSCQENDRRVLRTTPPVGCGINFCISYYNGCNECVCGDNGIEQCTQRECSISETTDAYCTGCESPFRLRGSSLETKTCVIIEPPPLPIPTIPSITIECPDGWQLDPVTKICNPSIACWCINPECKDGETAVPGDGVCNCPVCEPNPIIIIEPPPLPTPTIHTISCYDTSEGPKCCDPNICQFGSCSIGGSECEEGSECVQDPNNKCDLSTSGCVGVCVNADAVEEETDFLKVEEIEDSDDRK